jgi:hypothetical protein
MMVKGAYAAIAIILSILGALTLAYGNRVGLADVVRGGIAGFIFALAPVVVRIGYDVARSEKGEEEKRRVPSWAFTSSYSRFSNT